MNFEFENSEECQGSLEVSLLQRVVSLTMHFYFNGCLPLIYFQPNRPESNSNAGFRYASRPLDSRAPVSVLVR